MNRLHHRFYQPMTPELMAELEAYNAIREAEVQRVVRVLNSWPVGGVIAKQRQPTKRRRAALHAV